MAMYKADDTAQMTDKATKKAASLVETAADIAERTFEKTVDKADMASAETSEKLIRGARTANKKIHQNARPIGIGAMIAGAVMVVGGAIWALSKLGGKSRPRD